MLFLCSELPDAEPLRAPIVTGLGVMNVFAAVRENGAPRRRLGKIVAARTIWHGPAIRRRPEQIAELHFIKRQRAGNLPLVIRSCGVHG